MKTGLLAGCFAACTVAGLAAQPTSDVRWGPYRQTSLTSIAFREKWTTSPCGRGTGTGQYYWYHQFRNSAPVGYGEQRGLEIDYKLTYWDEGQKKTSSHIETVKPGQESSPDGAWLCASKTHGVKMEIVRSRYK
jgi:hypothetical protein